MSVSCSSKKLPSCSTSTSPVLPSLPCELVKFELFSSSSFDFPPEGCCCLPSLGTSVLFPPPVDPSPPPSPPFLHEGGREEGEESQGQISIFQTPQEEGEEAASRGRAKKFVGGREAQGFFSFSGSTVQVVPIRSLAALLLLSCNRSHSDVVSVCLLGLLSPLPPADFPSPSNVERLFPPPFPLAACPYAYIHTHIYTHAT